MTKKKIDVTEYASEIIKAMSKGILLTTQYEGKTNSMVIGWGHVGVIWGKPVFVAYVRESRYTRELLDKNPEFTVNVPVGDFDKKILAVCGSKSGRDMDKIKETGLTPVNSENISVPGLKEFPLTLECRVLYREEQDASRLAEKIQNRFYPSGASGKQDDHISYYGEILDAYIIED